MSVVLNHTIVRARDKRAAAAFLARLLGLPVGAPTGPFVPVRVNGELTLDFDDRGPVAPGHFGFLVDDETFDRLLEHVSGRRDIPFGSGPGSGWDRAINRLAGGRGVYVGDPDGHSYEFFTVAPSAPSPRPPPPPAQLVRGRHRPDRRDRRHVAGPGAPEVFDQRDADGVVSLLDVEPAERLHASETA